MWFFTRVCKRVPLYIFIALNMRFAIQLRFASLYKKQLINYFPTVCNKGCSALTHCVFNPHFFYTGCYLERGEAFCSHAAELIMEISLQRVTWSFLFCIRNLLNLAKRTIFMQAYFLGTWTYFEKFIFSFNKMKAKTHSFFYSHGVFLNKEKISQGKYSGLIPRHFMKGMLTRKLYENYTKPYWTKIRQTCLNELLFQDWRNFQTVENWKEHPSSLTL